MSENVLMRVDGISKSFFGLSVLRCVTLDIAQGTITGLIGPNGAGKSTLFNIVSGFLTPDAGENPADPIEKPGRGPIRTLDPRLRRQSASQTQTKPRRAERNPPPGQR